MSAYRTQALVEAPVEEVWELVGNPRHHPDWWPRVIEVKGERFKAGDEYVQVTRSPAGRVTTSFLIEKADDLREIRLICQSTGTYAHWLMTEAQGGTFLDVEFGMVPKALRAKLFDGAFGRIYFRRWLEQSVERLKDVARESPSRPTGHPASPRDATPGPGRGSG